MKVLQVLVQFFQKTSFSEKHAINFRDFTTQQIQLRKNAKQLLFFVNVQVIYLCIYFLFGVSAKHLSEEVSTTVSQKLTTGSATFISETNEKHNIGT